MAQVNVHVTPEFDEALGRLVRLRGLRSKSEAIRWAVVEALDREIGRSQTADFRAWLGAARAAPLNPKPRFLSEDELWGRSGLWLTGSWSCHE
jgi:Arc/MetJ-type ribon-helix-helix transcriptional regulator